MVFLKEKIAWGYSGDSPRAPSWTACSLVLSILLMRTNQAQLPTPPRAHSHPTPLGKRSLMMSFHRARQWVYICNEFKNLVLIFLQLFIH